MRRVLVAGQKSWDVFAEVLEKCDIVTTPGSGFGPAGGDDTTAGAGWGAVSTNTAAQLHAGPTSQCLLDQHACRTASYNCQLAHHHCTCAPCAAGEGFVRASAFGHRDNILEAVERFKKVYGQQAN